MVVPITTLYYGFFKGDWDTAIGLNSILLPYIIIVFYNGYTMLTLTKIIDLPNENTEIYNIIKETFKNLGWRIIDTEGNIYVKGGYTDGDNSWFSSSLQKEIYGHIFVFIINNEVYASSVPESNIRGGKAQVVRIMSLEKLNQFKDRLSWMMTHYDNLQEKKKEDESIVLPEELNEINIIEKEIEIIVQNNNPMPVGYKFEPYKIYGVIQNKVLFDNKKGVKLIVMLDRKIEGRNLSLDKFNKVSLLIITVYPKYVEGFYLGKESLVKLAYFKQNLYTQQNKRPYLDYKKELRVDETIITLDAKIQLI